MTITTSRWGLIVDQIVASLKLDPTFTDPVQLYDGPNTSNTEWMDAVWIGFDANWETGNWESAAIVHDWSHSGDTGQLEIVDVPCAVTTWTGDPDVKPIRDRALVLFGAVETMLRTDPTLGIDSTTQAEMTQAIAHMEPFQQYGGMGTMCRIMFQIHVETELGS